jgi:signal transduction histidine kinase
VDPSQAPDTEPSGARLTISTSLVDGVRVQVVVADTGHGITAQHLPQVFAPFFTTKGSARGTGLGLSIVKNIIENHSGAIRVESDPPRGTRFIILLPVDARLP